MSPMNLRKKLMGLLLAKASSLLAVIEKVKKANTEKEEEAKKMKEIGIKKFESNLILN